MHRVPIAVQLGELASGVLCGAVLGILLWYMAMAIARLRGKEWNEPRKDWVLGGIVFCVLVVLTGARLPLTNVASEAPAGPSRATE